MLPQIASGVARAGADIVVIDGFRGGTGAAPTRIRDNVGIPIELALAAADQRLRDEVFVQLFLLLPQVRSVVHPILLKQLLSVQMLAMLLLLPSLQWAAICAKHVIPVSVIGVLLLSVLTLHVVLILKSHIKG